MRKRRLLDSNPIEREARHHDQGAVAVSLPLTTARDGQTLHASDFH
jgi:hypothetical protein